MYYRKRNQSIHYKRYYLNLVTFQLIFLAMLVRLYSITSHELNKPDLASYFCFPKSEILEYFVDTFTEFSPTGRKITPMLKDKILSYILCLKLHLNNYMLVPQEFCGDFGISSTKICKIARELGTRVESRKDETGSFKIIRLVLPLVFPTKHRQ
jgi:hypothetical protein